MHLDDQVVTAILLRLLCVICLDKIDFERLALERNYVLNEHVHLDD